MYCIVVDQDLLMKYCIDTCQSAYLTVLVNSFEARPIKTTTCAGLGIDGGLLMRWLMVARLRCGEVEGCYIKQVFMDFSDTGLKSVRSCR